MSVCHGSAVVSPGARSHRLILAPSRSQRRHQVVAGTFASPTDDVNEQLDGLVPGDVGRDGRQLQMRIEDPNGAWTPSGIDPRLMVEREPDDHGDGPFYRLLSEGSVTGFDGSMLRAAPALAGVDSNRNFPYHWRRQPGHGGGFPASEPDVEAIVRGVVEGRTSRATSPTTRSPGCT